MTARLPDCTRSAVLYGAAAALLSLALAACDRGELTAPVLETMTTPVEAVSGRAKAAREVGITQQAAPKANRLGLAVHVASPEQRKAQGVKFGLVVESIDPAARAPQLNLGDVIAGINNTEFTTLEQFNEIVQRQKPGESVALLVRRGNDALYIPVKVQG